MKRLIPLLPLLLIAAGCSSDAAQATDEQVKNFKGGPMPANFKQRETQAMSGAAQAAQKAQASGGK